MKKLQLNKEVVSKLDNDQMGNIKGGTLNTIQTCSTYYGCNTVVGDSKEKTLCNDNPLCQPQQVTKVGCPTNEATCACSKNVTCYCF